MTTTRTERIAQKNQMIEEMGLTGELELFNTALTLLWEAFQTKKAGNHIAIYNKQNDTVKMLNLRALDKVKPTIRFV